MKKHLISVAVGALMSLSQAGAVPIDWVTRLSGYGQDPGGEFNVYSAVLVAEGYNNLYSPLALAVNGFGNTGIETFCLEGNEYFANSGTAVIGPNAILGGVDHHAGPGTGPAGDPISLGTAWLYDQFARGVLANYNYTVGSGRVASAVELQQAIWYLENETDLANPLSNVFLAAVNSKFGNLLAGEQDNNGTYQVAVLVMSSADGSNAQDMLIRVFDGGSALMLLGIGLSGVGMFSRRIRV